MALIDEVFGDVDSYKDQGGDFELLPDGAYVVAEVTAAPGKTNKNGAAYCVLESKTIILPEGLTGRYGSPKFWDHASFITPAAIDPTLPEDELKKAKGKFGAWVRRVRALGLEPKGIYDLDWTVDQVAGFYVPAIGRAVIIKTRLEPASGSYRAKNTARDYFPDTPESRAKHGLARPVGSDVTFDPDKMEL